MFTNTQALVIPEGEVVKIDVDGVVLWELVTESYKNWVKYSTESDGTTIYNNGKGYKVGYRVRSGGAEIESARSTITGYIKVTGGDVIRVSGADFLVASTENAINVSDASFTNLGQIVGNTSPGYGIFETNANLSSYGGWASVVEESYSIYKWIVPSNVGIEYIRVTGKTTNGSSLIVTVNEEIQW